MGVETIIYRDAPVDLEPLKAQIKILEAEIVSLKSRAGVLETDVEKLKP